MKGHFIIFFLISSLIFSQKYTTEIFDESGIRIGTEIYDSFSGQVIRKDISGAIISTAIRQNTPGMLITYEEDGSFFTEYGSRNQNSMSVNSDGSFTVYDYQGNSKTYSDGALISEIKYKSSNNSINNSVNALPSKNSLTNNGTSINTEPGQIIYKQNAESRKRNQEIGRAQSGDNYVLYSKLLDENLNNVKKETEALANAIQTGMQNAFYGAPKRKIPQRKITKKLEVDLSDYEIIVLNRIFGRGITTKKLKNFFEPHYEVQKKLKKKDSGKKVLFLSIYEENDNPIWPNYGYGNKSHKVFLNDINGSVYSAELINNNLIDLILPIIPNANISSTPYKTKLVWDNNVNVFPLPEAIMPQFQNKLYVSIPSNQEVTVLLRSSIKVGPGETGNWYYIFSEKNNVTGWVWSGVLSEK